MANGRMVTGGIVALEWFYRGAGLPFVARWIEWDVERYLRCSRGTPLGVGS